MPISETDTNRATVHRSGKGAGSEDWPVVETTGQAEEPAPHCGAHQGTPGTEPDWGAIRR